MPSGGYVITSDDVKNLAKVLRKVSPQLGRDMRRAIRTSAKPVISDMRSKIGGNSMSGGGDGIRPYDGPTGAGGITAKMTRAVRLRVSSGRVRIYVHEGVMGSASRVPAYIDAGKSWRHPVMGNRRAWVTQSGSATGWFTATARQHFPQIKREVQDTLDETARRVAAMI